jgi:signal transduction histidine kinase
MLKGYAVEAGRGIVGWVAQNGQSARVNDAPSDSRYDPTLADMIGCPARQILAAPLEADGAVIGAVELVNCRGNESFTVENERLLRLMGTQIARAVTDAREMVERKQRERLAAVGRMLSGLLHDLKTPMTVISGCAEFLVDQESREKRLELAERILRQLSDLEKMTADVMAFVRGESNVLIRRVYLHLFLDELAELLEREAGRSPVEICWHRGYEGAAYLDAGSIRRALLNISRNALQAMADGGRLDISTARKGNSLVFSVSDNGPGIPEEIRDTLFDPFVTCGKEDGTGLGLAIVRQAVRDHNGTIDVETVSDRGTTFTISLPFDLEEEYDPKKEKSEKRERP